MANKKPIIVPGINEASLKSGIINVPGLASSDIVSGNYNLSKQISGLEGKVGELKVKYPNIPAYKGAAPVSKGSKVKSAIVKGLGTYFNIIDIPRAVISTAIASQLNLAMGLAEKKGAKPSWMHYIINPQTGTTVNPLDIFRVFKPTQQHVFYSDILNSLFADKVDDSQSGGLSKAGRIGFYLTIGGLLLDIGLDPLTYLGGAGVGAKAAELLGGTFKVGRFSDDGARVVMRLTNKVDDIVRNTDKTKDVLSPVLQLLEHDALYNTSKYGDMLLKQGIKHLDDMGAVPKDLSNLFKKTILQQTLETTGKHEIKNVTLDAVLNAFKKQVPAKYTPVEQIAEELFGGAKTVKKVMAAKETDEFGKILNLFKKTVKQAGVNVPDSTLAESLVETISKLNKLNKEGGLFDDAIIKVKPHSPIAKNKALLSQKYKGTYFRDVFAGGDKIATIENKLPVGLYAEKIIGEEYPRLAQLINNLRKTFQSPLPRLINIPEEAASKIGIPAMRGAQSMGDYRYMVSEIRKLMSSKVYDAREVAKQLDRTLVRIAKDFNIPEESLKKMPYIIEKMMLTTKDVDEAYDFLSKAINKNWSKKKLAKAAAEWGTDEKTLLNTLENFAKKSIELESKGNTSYAGIKTLRELAEPLANNKVYKSFRESYDMLSQGEKEFLDTATKILDENFYKAVEGNVIAKESYIPGYVPHLYTDTTSFKTRAAEVGAKEIPIEVTFRRNKARVYENLLEARANAKDPIENLLYLTAYDSFETANAVRTRAFLDDIINNFGRLFDAKLVTESNGTLGVWKDAFTGKKYVFPSWVADALNKWKDVFVSPQSHSYFNKFWNKTTSLWKGYVTATPGFIARNTFFGNTWAGYLMLGGSFFNPEAAKEGFYTWFAQFPDMVERFKVLQGKSKISGKYYTELADELLRNNIFRGGQYAYDLQSKLTLWEEFQNWYNKGTSILQTVNPLNENNFYLKTFRQLGEFSEDIPKAMSYIIGLKKFFGDADTVSQLVKRYFFDYSELTGTEKKVFRQYFFPFYTWMRKNIPLQIEEMLAQTNKFKVFPLSKKYLEDVSANGAPDERYLPEYMKENYYIRTPIVDKYGNYLYFSPNFPPQDLAKIFSPSGFASMLNPIIQTPLELFFNQRMFGNTPIKTSPYDTVLAPSFIAALPPEVKQKLGLTTGADNKTYMSQTANYMLSQLPISRYPSQVFQQEGGTGSPFLDTLSTIFGIRLTPYDYNKELTNAAFDYRNSLTDYINYLEKLGYK